MSNDVASVLPEIPRDRFNRPQIRQADGKLVPYTRVTTFVDCLEDKYNLQKWDKRMVATGLSLRPDLLASVAAHLDDKRKLDAICDDAKEAARAGAKANIGTAVHKFTEWVDQDKPLDGVPLDYLPDLMAYAEATHHLQAVLIECFVVVDHLQTAGTTDRVVRLPNGRYYIADVKTGDITWGIGKIAMQLGTYSRGKRYNPDTGERIDLPPVDQDRGIVIHLPAGEGKCTLHWVDIAAGWDAVENLAAPVREWRKRKDLSAPIGPLELTGIETTYPALAAAPADVLADLIAAAGSTDDLRRLWNDRHTDFQPHHVDLAKQRTQLLQAGGRPA